jgi:alpha-tubulin suppressor-like RCC1 family protein
MLAAGERHACGVTKNSLVLCWGSNARGELGTGVATPSLVPTPVRGFVP